MHIQGLFFELCFFCFVIRIMLKLTFFILIILTHGYCTTNAQERERQKAFLKMNDSSEIHFRTLEIDYWLNTIRIVSGNPEYRRQDIPIYNIAYINNKGTYIIKIKSDMVIADTLTAAIRKRDTRLRMPVDNRVFARLVEDGKIKLFDFSLFPLNRSKSRSQTIKHSSTLYWLDPRDSLVKLFNYDSIRNIYPDLTITNAFTEQYNQTKKQAKFLLYLSAVSSTTGLVTYLISGIATPVPLIATGVTLTTLTIVALKVSKQNGRHYELIRNYNLQQ